MPAPLTIASSRALLNRPSSLAAQGVIIDTFNRADNAASLGQADTGQYWQGTGTYAIASNQLKNTGANGNPTWVETGYFDGAAQITQSINDIAAFSALVFRYSDDNNYWMVQKNASTGYSLIKRSNGSSNAVSTIGNYSAQDGDVLRVVLNGTLIVVEINGIALYSTSDSFNQFATKHGYRSGNTIPRADNFIFTPFTELVRDGFDRPDGALGNADTGQAWLTVGGNSLFSISSGRAYGNPAVTSWSIVDSGVSDGYVEAKFVSTTNYCRLIFRYKDSSNYWQLTLDSGGGIKLEKRIAGSLFTMIGVSGGVAGDIFRVVYVGNVYRVLQNGNLVASFTDTTNWLVSSTLVGLFNASSITSYLDDFRFTSASVVAFDRFNRGDSPSLGKAETGQSWANIGANFQILSGQAYQAVSSAGQNILFAPMADIAVQSNYVAGTDWGLYCDYSDNTNHRFIQSSGNSAINLYKTVSSVQTQIATFSPGSSIGLDVKLIKTAEGAMLAYRNGSYVGSIVDNTVPAGSRAGLRSNVSGNKFDNFLASVLPSPNLYDSFNRADSALTLGSADSGQAWNSSAILGPFGISGNQAYNTNAGRSVATTDIGISDFVITVTFAVITNFQRMIFRLSDSSNFLYVQQAGASGWTAQRRVAGVDTQIASSAIAAANGDVLTVICSGSLITAYANGIFLFTLTETTFQTATSIGLGIDGTVARFDNLKVRAL